MESVCKRNYRQCELSVVVDAKVDDMGSVQTRSNSSDILRSMDQCTKCGICHAHCPVAAVTGEFPGPKYAGPQAQRFRFIETSYEISPSLCTGCAVCTSVCPNNVAIADIITLAKKDVSKNESRFKFGQWLLQRPLLISGLGGKLPNISNYLLGNRIIRSAAERFLGIHKDAPLPTFKNRSFLKWLKNYHQPHGEKIAYFAGCTVDTYDPDVGISLVKILNHLGYSVETPESLCCSLPMLSDGEIEAARAGARSLVNTLLYPLASEGTKIITTSTSCGLALRSKYAAYLDMVDPQSEKVAGVIVDACEFILQNHANAICRSFSELPLKVFYHGPCQLRSHKMGQPAVELLQLIPEIQLALSQADCCGIGGTYGYHKEKHDISIAIGRKLVDQVKQFEPDIIVCDSETCRWNITSQTGIECVHPIELLLRALKRNV